MTHAQEIFDFVLDKLAEQGRPAMNADGSCYYRSPLGLKCAFGWLIPDRLYDPRIEGICAYMILKDTAALRRSDERVLCERLRQGLKLAAHYQLIADLQVAHDGNGPENWLKGWLADMEWVCAKHDLDPTRLYQIKQEKGL
jgi:hypothetical protein